MPNEIHFRGGGILAGERYAETLQDHRRPGNEHGELTQAEEILVNRWETFHIDISVSQGCSSAGQDSYEQYGKCRNKKWLKHDSNPRLFLAGEEVCFLFVSRM